MWSQGIIGDISVTEHLNIDNTNSEHALSLEFSLKAQFELKHDHISFPSDNLLSFDSNMVH